MLILLYDLTPSVPLSFYRLRSSFLVTLLLASSSVYIRCRRSFDGSFVLGAVVVFSLSALHFSPQIFSTWKAYLSPPLSLAGQFPSPESCCLNSCVPHLAAQLQRLYLRQLLGLSVATKQLEFVSFLQTF